LLLIFAEERGGLSGGELDGSLDQNSSVAEQVPQLSSAVGEHLADEKTPMTVARITLAADQCDAVLLRTVQQAVDGSGKRGLARHRTIECVPLSVVMLLA
jgi:hypothetical protein